MQLQGAGPPPLISLLTDGSQLKQVVLVSVVQVTHCGWHGLHSLSPFGEYNPSEHGHMVPALKRVTPLQVSH